MTCTADLRKDAAAWLRDRLEALPPVGGLDEAKRAAYRAAIDRLKADTADAWGAKIRDEWNGAALVLLGIRVTCTSGFVGACQNWLRRAEQ